MSEESERHLTEWAKGDEQAGEAVLAEFVPLLRRFFSTRTPHDPEELIQKTMLSLLRNVDGALQAVSLRAYVLRCARNRLIDHVRAQTRDRVDPWPTSSIAGDRATPSEHLQRRDISAAVFDCMSNLSDRLRQPLELHYWEGLRVDEVAEVLQIPLSTAKSRMRLARARFARTFEARYPQLKDLL